MNAILSLVFVYYSYFNTNKGSGNIIQCSGTVICPDETRQLSCSVNSDFIQWKRNNCDIPGGYLSTLNAQLPGVYRIKYFSENTLTISEGLNLSKGNCNTEFDSEFVYRTEESERMSEKIDGLLTIPILDASSLISFNLRIQNDQVEETEITVADHDKIPLIRFTTSEQYINQEISFDRSATGNQFYLIIQSSHLSDRTKFTVQ